MNAHQRRKQRRRLLAQGTGQTPPTLVHNWEELAQIPASATHRIVVYVDEGCADIINLETGEDIYLSTHTFYPSRGLYSTMRLRQCGFNVTIRPWKD